eukprot:TRINITY_DN1999_c0_g3_i1.p1 TRINITY_DN1999_c0_g3~~TRINITY_DN1999_c0_g3_i1.p1  ORF type:complete len:750 (-),score=130.05 TRINITY_DN1999_c0_g3_i1:694-2943(-)
MAGDRYLVSKMREEGQAATQLHTRRMYPGLINARKPPVKVFPMNQGDGLSSEEEDVLGGYSPPLTKASTKMRQPNDKEDKLEDDASEANSIPEGNEISQTLHFVHELESTIASGPHGRLDDYLPVVDLLFNAQKLFQTAGCAEGVQLTKDFLSTAMGDLEHEYRDILTRRTSQTLIRVTRDHLKHLLLQRQTDALQAAASSGLPLSPSSSISTTPPLSSIRMGAANSNTSSSQQPSSRTNSFGGTGEVSEAVALELLSASTIRWLQEIAARMKQAGVGKRCADACRAARGDFLKQCLEKMELAQMGRRPIGDMPWEVMEKTCKEWMFQVKALVGVLLVGEINLCHEVLGAMGPEEEERTLGGLLRDQALEPMTALLRMGRAISLKRFAEQLFVMLDMFATLDELLPDIRRVFSRPGIEEIPLECEDLSTLLAHAAGAAFEQLKSTLQSESARLPAPYVKPSRGIFRARTRHEEDDNMFDEVPRDGGVHPITGYVTNYIRGYLHRAGGRNYVSALERVFSMEGNGGGGGGGPQRTVDDETAHLVMALRKCLESKSRLYRDEALRELFLLNNLNYLYRSMLLWHGWHGRGMLRALATAKSQGKRDVVLALTGLQDERSVSCHAVAFQRIALKRVETCLAGEVRVDKAYSSGKVTLEVGSVAQAKARLKKFNLAFEDLCIKAEEWVVPDDELRVRLRGTWMRTIKEKYRQLLMPFWKEVTSSKHYLYRLEDIDMKMSHFFSPLTHHSQSCQF